MKNHLSSWWMFVDIIMDWMTVDIYNDMCQKNTLPCHYFSYGVLFTFLPWICVLFVAGCRKCCCGQTGFSSSWALVCFPIYLHLKSIIVTGKDICGHDMEFEYAFINKDKFFEVAFESFPQVLDACMMDVIFSFSRK